MTIKNELLRMHSNLLYDELWWGHLRRKMWKNGEKETADCRRVSELEMQCVKTRQQIGDILEHFNDGRDLLVKNSESVYDDFSSRMGFTSWREFIMADRAD